MHEFKQLVLGNVSIAYYAAAEFFALLALVLSLWLHSQKRDKAAPTTPEPFSWIFLIMDNVKRIVVGQIALFLIFRFASEVLGRQLNMYMAVGIGFALSYGLDKFIQYLKQKTSFFDIDRSKITTTQPPNP